MDTVVLGRSGLHVTPLCFGTWEYGGEWGNVDEAAAKATIRRARELGINFFDTAQAYGFGTSERILGAALAGELRTARDDIVIATKGGLRRAGDQMLRDSSAEWLHQGVDASLRALDVDVIDLYQIHWPDPNTPYEETGEALRELVDTGKIRHVGLSNFDVDEMRLMQDHGPVETLQPPYHMFRREIEESILPYTQAHDLGVLIYGPLAHGLLSGAMTSATRFASSDWRSQSADFSGETFRQNLEVVNALTTFARSHGYSIATLSIAWTLSNPAVHAAIVGSDDPKQMSEDLKAVEIRLTPDDLAEIDRILENAVPVRGPSPEGG